jgi:hypothetical protein
MARTSQIDPSRLLQDTEERPIGISLPVPLSKRLDLLVERAERAGARAYRKDILAALILAAPEDPEELLDLFSRYRRATAEHRPTTPAAKAQTTGTRGVSRIPSGMGQLEPACARPSWRCVVAPAPCGRCRAVEPCHSRDR